MGEHMRLRVPLNRRLERADDTLNVGTEHIEVPVVIQPDLSRHGEYGYAYDYSRVIRLREWNEQVLLHEILHVVIDPLGLADPIHDPEGHNVVARVEVALWETGWRLASPPGVSDAPT